MDPMKTSAMILEAAIEKAKTNLKVAKKNGRPILRLQARLQKAVANLKAFEADATRWW